MGAARRMGHPLTKYYNGGSEWGTPHIILKWGAVKGTPLTKYTNGGGGGLRGMGITLLNLLTTQDS